MNTKLTLRMEEDIIIKIKKFSNDHNISVSKLTERLFEDVLRMEDQINSKLSPIAKKYKGILSDSKEDYDDLKFKSLKEKYE